MRTGPVDIPGVEPQLQPPRPSVTPRPAPDLSSQHSGKTIKKEAVRLTYTSAQPDFAETPSQHGSQGKGFRPDTGYVPRYQGINRLRGFSMASFYGASDLHIFPTIRGGSRPLQNQQMLPRISVVPATKHKRSSHKRGTGTEINHSTTPQPVSVKRVEVSLHQVHKRNKTSSGNALSPPEDHENLTAPPKVDFNRNLSNGTKETTNVPLNSVDLNKGLNIASAIRRRARENMKSRVATLEKSLAAKEDPHVLTLNYLPLKEVYLKPDITSKKQALKQQQDKTARILQWLKGLKYLDESTVNRSRLEVEKSNFQLPEINDSSKIGYL